MPQTNGAAVLRNRPLRCVIAGTVVALSLPPWGWWPLAFVGVVVFELALGSAPSRRQRAGYGFAFAAPWMALGMGWMMFLTLPGYIVAVAMFAGMHAAAAAIAPTGPWRTIGRPAAHTIAEAIRLMFPFGGVPLATLGISQASGPLLGTARVGGVILITWIVFQIGMSLGGPAPVIPKLPVLKINERRSNAKAQLHGVAGLAAVVIVIVVAAVAPAGYITNQEPLEVAAVQGGGQQGTSALEVPSSKVTQALLDATAGIEPNPGLDLVVWPENGIDVNEEPFAGSSYHAAVGMEATRLGVPIAVGVTEDSEFSNYPTAGQFVNAQVIVTDGGAVVSRYEKVKRVPFGEYIPLRGLFESIGAPTDQIPTDAIAGRDPAIITLPDGTDIGVMISWEVFFGSRARAAADAGFLLNPTNGASYTGTILQTQQIASSQLRAVETGRWVVQVSPTGFSAFVSPDGAVLHRTGVSERQVITSRVPIRGGATWYTTLGDVPWILAAFALLVFAIWSGRRAPTCAQ